MKINMKKEKTNLERFKKAMEPPGYRKPIKIDYLKKAKKMGINLSYLCNQADARENIETHNRYYRDLKTLANKIKQTKYKKFIKNKTLNFNKLYKFADKTKNRKLINVLDNFALGDVAGSFDDEPGMITAIRKYNKTHQLKIKGIRNVW